MTTEAPSERGRPVFRRIVWPFAVAETIVWASFYYSFPALLPEWERSLGWSKTDLAGAFTLALVLSALLAPVAGSLIDRGLSRTVFTGSALMGAVLLMLLSQVTEIWQFYAVWAGLGIAMAGALYEACFAIVTRALGGLAKRSITLITLVAGFAGTVSFPSAHTLVGMVGWQGTVLVFAGVVAFVAAPLIWAGCRNAEALRQNTGSETEDDAETAQPRQTASARWVFRSPIFWLLALSFGAIALEHGAVITHLLLILDERSIDPAGAVFAAAMIGPMQVAGRLAMMTAERHVSIFGIGVGCFIGMTVAAVSLLNAGDITGLIIAFVVLHGAAYGVTSITRPVITAEMLGRRNFGAISGMLAVPFMIGFAISPTLASVLWETGGYDLVLYLCVAVLMFGLAALLIAGRIKNTSKK